MSYRWFLIDVTSTPNMELVVWILLPPSTSIAKFNVASSQFLFFSSYPSPSKSKCKIACDWSIVTLSA
jgi:hypothetical protein